MLLSQRLIPLVLAFERIRTASVLAPLLVLDVITGVFASIATPFLDAGILWFAWGPFGVCVVFTLAAYTYWSFQEPDRLQTEQYQLDQRRLLLIGDERDPNSPAMIESAPTSNTLASSSQR